MPRPVVLVKLVPSRSQIAGLGGIHVRFHSGGLYSYGDISPAEHAGLMAAPSKGQYLSYVIRPRHRGTRIA